MIISAKLCFNSTRNYRCCKCDEVIRIPYLRLYGNADGGRRERKWVVQKCIDCVCKSEYSGDETKLTTWEKDTIQMWADEHCYRLGIV